MSAVATFVRIQRRDRGAGKISTVRGLREV
jgi:hypothetical protein